MKHYVFDIVVLCLLGTFLVWGCGDSDNVTISKREYWALKGDSTALKYPKEFTVNGRTYAVNLGTDGHEYYSMRIATGGYTNEARDFHYPGCVKEAVSVPEQKEK